MKLFQRFSNFVCFAATLLLVLAPPVSAQEDPRFWDANGVAIRQGTHMEWASETALHIDGSVCIVWTDTRDGLRRAYAQVIDPAGDPAWPDGGVVVANQTDPQEYPDVAATDGGWIFGWVKYDLIEPAVDPVCSVWAQKLNLNGERLWGEEGVFVQTTEYYYPDEVSVQLISDLSGGALVAWLSWPTVDVQHIDAIGDRLWTESVQLGDHVQEFGIAPDGLGNALVAWVDDRESSDRNVYAAKIAGDGSLPWTGGTNGIPVCAAVNVQRNIEVCSDFVSGGMYCAWKDLRSSTDDLYTQKIDADGVIQWQENGVVLCDAVNNQGSLRVSASFNGGVQDGFIAVWTDVRVNAFITEIFGQKITEDGTVAWEANGLRIYGNAGTNPWGNPCSDPQIASDFSGGAVFVWTDTRNSNGEWQEADLYAQRVTPAGSPLWGIEGSAIQAEDKGQVSGIPAVRSGESDVVFAFENFASGSSNLEVRMVDLTDGTPLTEASTRLIEGHDEFISSPRTVAMDHGRAAVIWRNISNSGGNYIQYQIFDTTGAAQFEAGGTPLAPDNEDWPYFQQRNPEVCPDGAGGFFVCFNDLRTGVMQIRLSHVNADGEMDSDDAGVAMPSSGRDLERAFVVADGNGGCYAAWSGYDENFILEAYIMHANADCQPTWTQPVQLTSTPDVDDYLHGIVTSTSGSCIMTWTAGDESEGQIDLFAARVGLDGSVLWNNTVCGADRRQDEPTIVSDEQGGAYFVWTDERSPASEEDIYGQHLADNGEELWQHDGIIVHIGDNEQWNPQAVYSPENGLYAVWEDFRSGNDIDLYAQRLDEQGNPLWPLSGQVICDEDGYQENPQMIPNNLGGFTCVWQDARLGYRDDIYGTDILPDGSICREWWSEGSGGEIVSAFQHQMVPCITEMSNYSAFVAWIDWRATVDEVYGTQDLYCQRIVTGSGIEAVNGTPQMPLAYALHQNYPNPFNPTTTISFSIAKAGTVSLVVYDLLGRSVTTLMNEHLNSGSYQVPWDASDLPSGMYFYRLTTGNFTDVKKTVLLK